MKSPVATFSCPVLIKWPGSKRRQALSIIKRFPARIGTYYEPFLGSGAMLWALLSTEIQVQSIECSDICRPLVDLWQIVRDDPKSLLQRYSELREQFVASGKDRYYEVRDDFNQTNDPYLFFFLSRTCRLGHVRFNRRDEFSAPVHHGYFGIEPHRLEPVIEAWHRKLTGRRIVFSCRDYKQVRSRPGDLLYLDPPYRTRHRIYGRIDFSTFFRWLSMQDGGYLISLNGFLNDQDKTVEVPTNLFDEHVQLEAGSNPQLRLGHGVIQQVTDSLYVRQRRPRLPPTPKNDPLLNKSEEIRRILSAGINGKEPKPKQIRDILMARGIDTETNLIKIVRHHWRRSIVES